MSSREITMCTGTQAQSMCTCVESLQASVCVCVCLHMGVDLDGMRGETASVVAATAATTTTDFVRRKMLTRGGRPEDVIEVRGANRIHANADLVCV